MASEESDFEKSYQKPKAAQFFTSLNRRADYLFSNYLVSMFTQDVPLGLIPYRSTPDRKFAVVITGDAADVASAEELLRSIDRQGGGRRSEAVAGAIREIAQSISWHGRAPYEILREEGSEKRSYALVPFTPLRLFRVPGYVIQLVPRADWPSIGKRIIVLRREDVWFATVPKKLGGVRKYKQLLRSLARFSGMGPRFWQDEVSQGNVQNSKFDFEVYRREVDVYQSRLTRRWGWNGRDTGSTKWTEFAMMYRLIRFSWAQAVLREHIIFELNQLLRHLGIDATITESGLPNSEEIAKMQAEVLTGSLSFSKAYEAVR